MTDWNFEGSKDGEEWVVLHKARNDRHLAKPDGNIDANVDFGSYAHARTMRQR